MGPLVRRRSSHSGTVFAVFAWRSRLFVSSAISASSGQPYTVTTGNDGNGDGVMNDRPSGVRRNTHRQPGQWLMHVHVALNVRSAAVGASSDGAGRIAGGQIPRVRKLSLQLFVDVQNALNAPGWSGYSGVAASPLFGRPTSAMAPRRIECGFAIRY